MLHVTLVMVFISSLDLQQRPGVERAVAVGTNAAVPRARGQPVPQESQLQLGWVEGEGSTGQYGGAGVAGTGLQAHGGWLCGTQETGQQLSRAVPSLKA